MGEAACWADQVCPACGRMRGEPVGAGRPLLLLVGLMGVGKTTVGRLVADRLGWRFVDNDELFRERTGTTPSVYAAEHGDDAMHRVEWALLADVLDRVEPTVLAAPGSVVDAPALDLDEAFVVWLQVDPEVVAGRVEVGDHRPLLGETPGEVLARQLRERSGRYGELADLTVPATDRTPSEAADRIVDAWCDHH